MKKKKFIPSFSDIPTRRQKMPHLSLDERRLNFREVELGFTEEMAIAEARRCLSCRRCIGCGLCLAECDQKAIVYDEAPETIKLAVGAIILAPGFDEFDPNRKRDLGYGKYFNVITSIELERIMSPTGPYGGILMRPYDGEVPSRIAFVQCVGSREEGIGANYCSNICCMHALKQAISAQERIPGLRVKVFHKDIRPYGKGSEAYYLRAKDELGIEFVRAEVAAAEQDEATGNIQLKYRANGQETREEFDLVVLSVGLQAPRDARAISRRTRVRLNKYGFCLTSPFSPAASTEGGVFVAGAFSGPKGICQSIVQASGAASKVAGLLSEKRGKITSREGGGGAPGEGKGEVGVFLCQYGLETNGGLKAEELKGFLSSLPQVKYWGEALFLCLKSGKEAIQRAVRQEGITKVVILPCYRKTHLPLFQAMLSEAGLASGQVEIVDFSGDGRVDGQKALRLLEKAIVREKTPPSGRGAKEITPVALVLGGGISGMTAALDIASQGFDVHLVEKAGELGGNLRKIRYSLFEENPQERLNALIAAVEGNERIRVYKNSTFSRIEGEVGAFRSLISSNGKEETIDHGVLILATGGAEYQPTEYLYGEDERVITQRELEERLISPQSSVFSLESLVMIQCIGSRNKEHPYCSRICCSRAIKNALKIKESRPETSVYILHRDIRVYDFWEDFYSEALERGVQFIRMEGNPSVKDGEKLTISLVDGIIREKIDLHADLVVLSTGIVPGPNNPEIAELLSIPLDAYGFFQEADPNLRPVEFEREGFFLCGLAHSPMPVDECVAQASAAAGKACLVLVQSSV